MEADAVVGTIYAIHEHRVKENINYPTHLNHRSVMIANMYTKLHLIMRSTLSLIGLKHKAVSDKYLTYTHYDFN